ncbi:dihydrolipoyl dehydrogenase [Bdellovibrio bacteriovorus]|uniref:Dihydrolipoyl dehydrogenase n=1 Tax=Bdellovibrio bacteriovorus (strain ATCC 15356 / DSM 50701 / NCIMB 9529 / HD100) TaxID=264462 RepID=Q6MJP0_BDEBA|nr:dihydrolipoyl dehydrogenase [Bdellovibrio bacteriovorus]CAE80520.1 dihydrolipoamide dehydrogenase [Bdellovibrio bacteriovorus HD100]
MADTQFDLIIIGSGPGGYVGAIRAAQLGLKTAVIEKDKTYGGTCLNVGCIPSKALLESSEHYQAAQHDLAAHGVKVSKVDLDLPTMQARKDKVVKTNTEGIAFLFKKNKITPFNGMGKIVAAGKVEVKGADGNTQILTAKNIVIATGSVPVELPFLKYDEKRIVSNTGALALDQVPKSMIVVGGGVIGLELGSVWQRLGAKVTVIEYANRLGGTMDQDCMNVLKKSMEKEGMSFLLSTKVTGSKVGNDGVEVTYESLTDGKASSMKADVVLVSTGRKAFSAGVGCEEMGIQKDPQGRIIVDKHYQTNVPGIYAIGDVIAGPMLAHKAEEEGVALAEILAGGAGHVNYDTVPGVIYTHPEIASVGITEEFAKEKGLEINVGKFPFMANGRARAKGYTEGFVKIIADKKTDKILGAHMVGPSVSELIHEVIVCMEFGGSSEDLARSFHAHPTLSEVVREAALAVEKRQRQM